MARVELAPELADDFDRIFNHLARHGLEHAAARIQEIVQAFDVLQTNPLIGRPASGGVRELVIGHRSRGYVALYRYVPAMDTVFILALRGQREAGYQRG
ncbi:MAG: type II toxin-antitoxin system RelE/ParE family toxin [Burkholderiaceae bacterium]